MAKAASVLDVKRLEGLIKEDAKHANDLTKIMTCLKKGDKSLKHAALQSLQRLFIFYAEKGDLRHPNVKSKVSKAVKIFRTWLWKHYVSFLKELTATLLQSKDDNTQELAFRAIMEFATRESSIQESSSGAAFGNDIFSRAVNSLVHLQEPLSDKMQRFLQGEWIAAYPDVQFYWLKNLTAIVEQRLALEHKYKNDPKTLNTKAKIPIDVFTVNTYKLLKMVDISSLSKADLKPSSFLVPSEASLAAEDEFSDENEDCGDSSDDDTAAHDRRSAKKRKLGVSGNSLGTKTEQKSSLKGHRVVFSSCWLAFLRLPLLENQYIEILDALPEDVMPFLTQPLLLADFLTDSYNVGGVTSLLALNSLFILMQKYNFDYPDFYNKLYRLVKDGELYDAKYRARFFRLLHLFMSSSHLPVYLVAAFSKRLCRMALFQDPGVIMFVLPFVYNLLIRHKECLELIHRTRNSSVADQAARKRELMETANEVEKKVKLGKTLHSGTGEDLFDDSAEDPIESRALESSLWEIKTFQQHYSPSVAVFAKNFEEKLRGQAWNIEEYVGVQYKSIFDEQIKRRIRQPTPVAFTEFEALFPADDLFRKVFAM